MRRILALERHITYKDQPLAQFQHFVELVVATINAPPRPAGGPHPPACLLGQFGIAARRDDVELADILPTLQKAKVGGFVLPFANPRHAHEFHCFAQFPLDGRSDPGRRRHRQPDEFRRAPGSRRRPHRAGRRRHRRSVARARRHRLRLRHHGGLGPRRRGRGVGETQKPERRRADRVEAVCSEKMRFLRFIAETPPVMKQGRRGAKCRADVHVMSAWAPLCSARPALAGEQTAAAHCGVKSLCAIRIRSRGEDSRVGKGAKRRAHVDATSAWALLVLSPP